MKTYIDSHTLTKVKDLIRYEFESGTNSVECVCSLVYRLLSSYGNEMPDSEVREMVLDIREEVNERRLSNESKNI